MKENYTSNPQTFPVVFVYLSPLMLIKIVVYVIIRPAYILQRFITKDLHTDIRGTEIKLVVFDVKMLVIKKDFIRVSSVLSCISCSFCLSSSFDAYYKSGLYCHQARFYLVAVYNKGFTYTSSWH